MDLDKVMSEDFIVCAKQSPQAYALLIPILLKHVELDTESALSLLAASAQFLLPDQLEWLTSCAADGSLSFVPSTDDAEEVYNAVKERKDLEASEKRDVLRIVFAEYDYRGALPNFIQGTLSKDIKVMEPNLLSCFPITASTIKSILLYLPAQDAERVLDSLFVKNKDELTKAMVSAVVEGSTEKAQLIDAISKMGSASQWASHNERLKEAIGEEHKKDTDGCSTMKRPPQPPLDLEQLPPKTQKVE